MTYLGLLGLTLLPPIGWLAARARTRNVAPAVPTTRQVGALAVLMAVALAATVPWDAVLIARGTWTYPSGLQLGRLLGVPTEELLFMAGQPLLVGLWLRCRSSQPAQPVARPAQVRWTGAAGWLGVGLLGGLLATAERTSYLGLLLAWAGPLLALQWAIGGDRLWRSRALLGPALAVPTLYLCAVDRLALALRLWQLSPTRTTGLQLLGLPLEEAVFFLVTNLLIVGGLLLAADLVSIRRVASLRRSAHTWRRLGAALRS